jgi:LmbE family N-acetylglucosaminyl deacetylase
LRSILFAGLGAPRLASLGAHLLASLGASILACACSTPAGSARVPITELSEVDGPSVLCIVAHPDDETVFAATLYKTATHLGGACDILLITNGEGGFKYSTLAERIYSLELTDEAVGRAHLPQIRRAEFLEGCAFLGVRDALFLNQRDHRYSQDPAEVLAHDAGVWNLMAIELALDRLLREGSYDFVLTHLPTPTTHGHHQAATLLALRAVNRMLPSARPVVLGATTDTAATFTHLPGHPESQILPGPVHEFDRTQPFGHRGKLDYRIVVNWVIAAHKSQGTMQLAMSRGERERYFVFDTGTADAHSKAAAWFQTLTEPQFPQKTYGASAGTNAAAN